MKDYWNTMVSLFLLVLGVSGCNNEKHIEEERILFAPIAIEKVTVTNKIAPLGSKQILAVRDYYLRAIDSVAHASRQAFIDTSGKQHVNGYTLEICLDRNNDKRFSKNDYAYSITYSKEQVVPADSMLYSFTEGRFAPKDLDMAYTPIHLSFFYRIGFVNHITDVSRRLASDTSKNTQFTCSVDSLSISDDFSDAQKEYFKRLVNNSFVNDQRESKHSYHFEPNFAKDNVKKSDMSMNFRIFRDQRHKDKIIVNLSYYRSKGELNQLVPNRLKHQLILNDEFATIKTPSDINLQLTLAIQCFLGNQFYFEKNTFKEL